MLSVIDFDALKDSGNGVEREVFFSDPGALFIPLLPMLVAQVLAKSGGAEHHHHHPATFASYQQANEQPATCSCSPSLLVADQTASSSSSSSSSSKIRNILAVLVAPQAEADKHHAISKSVPVSRE
jgi:hypothetical protein